MLKPDHIFNTFTDITVPFLKENGITALLLDVDNTLTTAHKSKQLRSGAEEWFRLMRDSGISLIILSNAKSDRIRPFAESIGLDYVGLAAKPLLFGYFRAAAKLGKKHSETAMVGDQIFTDILGANLAGMRSILVTDITPEDSASFRIRRKLEKRILRK